MTILESLPRTPAVVAMRQRHCAYFAELADQAIAELIHDGTPAPPQVEAPWIELLEAEQDNLRAATQWALDEGDADTAARLTLALGRWLLKRRAYQEGLQWCDRVLAAEHRLGPEPLTLVALLATQLATQAGDYDRACDFADVSLAAVRPGGPSVLLYRALFSAAYAYGYGSRYADRDAAAAECVTVCRELGDEVKLAWALLRQAVSFAYDEYQEAVPALDEAAGALRALPDRRQLVLAAEELGVAYARMNEYEEAEAVAAEAIGVARQLGGNEGEDFLVYLMGQLRLVTGDLTGAAAAYREAMQLYERKDDIPGVVWSLEGEARVSAVIGDLSLAEELLQRARLSFDGLSNRGAEEQWLEAGLLGASAEVARLAGDDLKATSLLEQAAAVPTTEGSAFPISLRNRLGELAELRGDREAAQRWYAAAAEANARWREGDEPQVFGIFCDARIAGLAGEVDRQIELHDRAVELARETRSGRLPELLRAASVLRLHAGDAVAARTTADEAVTLSRRSRRARDIAESLLVRAEVAVAEADSETASACVAVLEARHLLIPAGYLGWEAAGDPSLLERLRAVEQAVVPG